MQKSNGRILGQFATMSLSIIVGVSGFSSVFAMQTENKNITFTKVRSQTYSARMIDPREFLWKNVSFEVYNFSHTLPFIISGNVPHQISFSPVPGFIPNTQNISFGEKPGNYLSRLVEISLLPIFKYQKFIFGARTVNAEEKSSGQKRDTSILDEASLSLFCSLSTSVDEARCNHEKK